MLRRLFDQIVDVVADTDPVEAKTEKRTHAIRMATAVLMIDVALADKVFEESELQHVLDLVRERFDLTDAEATDLVDSARGEAEEIVSLHEFTHLLHNSLDDSEKESVVGMLWEIAYADGQLDKFENALILKISDLLYVNRARVMRLKHDAEVAQAG